MKKALVSLALCAGMAFIFSCSSSDNATGGGNGGSGANANGGSGGSGCVNTPTSSTDGKSACESVDNGCLAGTHCTSGGVNCLDGCISTANCGTGEACDLSAGTKDMEGKATGVCRVPTPCPVGTGGTAGSGGSSGGGMNCLFAGGDTYVTCVETACDSQFKAAFGDAYKTAPAGACDAFMKCMSQAGCSQAAVQGCAVAATSACQQALVAANTCVSNSSATCMGGVGGSSGMGGMGGMGGAGGSGPGFECSLLKSCCDTGTFPDQATKDTCNQEVTAGNETTCSSSLFSFQTAGYCN